MGAYDISVLDNKINVTAIEPNTFCHVEEFYLRSNKFREITYLSIHNTTRLEFYTPPSIQPALENKSEVVKYEVIDNKLIISVKWLANKFYSYNGLINNSNYTNLQVIPLPDVDDLWDLDFITYITRQGGVGVGNDVRIQTKYQGRVPTPDFDYIPSLLPASWNAINQNWIIFKVTII